jgi:hypothetical protein
MNDYHFEYSGEVIIAADTYEEAEKLLKNMMWDVRGVYNYQMINFSVSMPDKVTRVEVIDQDGRSYVNWDESNKVELSFQDDGRTLKVFISNREEL